MASRKAETETLGIGVSKGRAKSAIAGTNTDLAKSKASSGAILQSYYPTNSLSHVCCGQAGHARTDQT